MREGVSVSGFCVCRLRGSVSQVLGRLSGDARQGGGRGWVSPAIGRGGGAACVATGLGQP